MGIRYKWRVSGWEDYRGGAPHPKIVSLSLRTFVSLLPFMERWVNNDGTCNVTPMYRVPEIFFSEEVENGSDERDFPSLYSRHLDLTGLQQCWETTDERFELHISYGVKKEKESVSCRW